MVSGIVLISLLFSGIGMLLSNTLRAKFAKYNQLRLAPGMTGAQVAHRMLAHYGLHDVKITAVPGALTDHYNPANRTVNLSEAVYSEASVSAAAVAAHECGHAVQHATMYPMLKMRSALVPAVKAANTVMPYLFMFGFSAAAASGNELIVYVLLAVFATTALFSLVTLPVEFDASRRALNWLDESGMMRGNQYDGAKDALKWAALTYVAAALAAILQLLYIAYMLMGRRER